MIDSLFTEKVTVRRVEGSGEYIRGRFTGVGVAEFDVMASVQPSTGEELLNPPEGQRTTEILNIFTKTELFTVEKSQFKKADVVVYNGRKFEVMKVERWPSLIPHYKVIVSYILDNAEGEA